MRLVFLPVPQTWVFLFGDQTIRISDFPMFYATRADAVAVALRAGLAVDKAGRVTVRAAARTA